MSEPDGNKIKKIQPCESNPIQIGLIRVQHIIYFIIVSDWKFVCFLIRMSENLLNVQHNWTLHKYTSSVAGVG